MSFMCLEAPCQGGKGLKLPIALHLMKLNKSHGQNRRQAFGP